MFKKVKEVLCIALLMAMFTLAGFIAPMDEKENCNAIAQRG